MRANVRKTPTMKLRPTEDGLHLSDSILWLDAHLRGDLSFLSSAYQHGKTTVPQVIATEETVKLLEILQRKRPNALVCQYNRPFSIGRLKMELLPSGSILGGASLYVETDEGRLLYATQVQSERIATVRQMQLRKADTLVLGAAHPDPGVIFPTRRKEKERLVDDIRAFIAEGKYPTIYCEPLGAAPEITQLLINAEIPVAVHRDIYLINDIYETYGSRISASRNRSYSCFNARARTRQRVTIMPAKLLRSHKVGPQSADSPQLIVEESPSPPGTEKNRYCLSQTCDGQNLKEVIQAVRPSEIYVFGLYTKAYVDWLRPQFPSVKPLFLNDQPTLL